MQNVQLKCWNDKSHCQVSIVVLKSLDVNPCNELLLLPMIIKNYLAWAYFFTHRPTSTFGVHYRTRSPGQLGLRVAGFPGHLVAGSQNAPPTEDSNRNVFNWRQKVVVDRSSFSCVDSLFHARGAATLLLSRQKMMGFGDGSSISWTTCRQGSAAIMKSEWREVKSVLLLVF